MCFRVICTPYQNNVNETHPDKKRDYAGNHELVFGEESIRPLVSTDDSDEDDDERENGAPPADQQSGVVLRTRMRIWRDISVYAPGDEPGERGGHCPAGSRLPAAEMQCNAVVIAVHLLTVKIIPTLPCLKNARMVGIHLKLCINGQRLHWR
jgi:hypothetical protein